MASARGREDVSRFIGGIPPAVKEKILRGAVRTMANVVADEARDRCISAEVAGAIKVMTKITDDRVIAKVQVKGPGSWKAPWLEHGTAPHFISVDDSQRGGLSVRRVNERKEHDSLVINGKFVGATIFHPGARPHPFLRPAFDFKEAEAFAAGQAYINARVTPAGITGADSGDGDA